MINVMKFWNEETDIDGFQCDLTEDEKAFGRTHSRELHKLMNDIAQGKNTVADLDAYQEKQGKAYPKDAYRM